MKNWNELPRYLRWGIFCSVVFFFIGTIFFLITAKGSIDSIIIELLVWVIIGLIVGMLWGSGNKEPIAFWKSFLVGLLFGIASLILYAVVDTLEQMYSVLWSLFGFSSECFSCQLFFPIIFGAIFLIIGILINKVKSKKEQA